VFPEPFGLDRHRLRLKSGATEKLKLSFLPFVMPAAAAPATSPSKGRKPGKGSGAENNVQEPPRVRSLLVLKDSDCGEFTYELIGEVGQPATFLQHETKVGLDGQQVGIKASIVYTLALAGQAWFCRCFAERLLLHWIALQLSSLTETVVRCICACRLWSCSCRTPTTCWRMPGAATQRSTPSGATRSI
jgi:hypothetical protein